MADTIRHTCLESEASSTGDFLRDAVRHTFVHESNLNGVSPSFWMTNHLKFPCYYDHNVFEGPVFSYPRSYSNHRWMVSGIFCSPNCAKKYISMSKHIPTSIYTLFSLMMRMVYNCSDEIVPAADVELLLNPLEPMTVQAWREIPRRHVQVRLTLPELIPFQMQSIKVTSYPSTTHPGYEDLRKISSLMAERGELPEGFVDIAQVMKKPIEEDSHSEEEGGGVPCEAEEEEEDAREEEDDDEVVHGPPDAFGGGDEQQTLSFCHQRSEDPRAKRLKARAVAK